MQILTIAGNVGKDAELRRTQGGDPVLNFSLAVDNGKDRDGNKREPSWFDCAVWGKRAEALQSYIKKGDKLAVSGRPTARAHEGKAYLGINVNEVTFQGGSGGGSAPGQGGSDRGSAPHDDGYGAGGRAMDDEIPFTWEGRA